jgi:hypothetical protein
MDTAQIIAHLNRSFWQVLASDNPREITTIGNGSLRFTFHLDSIDACWALVPSVRRTVRMATAVRY